MSEQQGYVPPEGQQQPEVPIVREGLSAIVLPELGKLNPRNRNYEPVSEQETMDKLNTWLEGLNRQGVDIVSVMDVAVDVGRRGGISGNVSETRKVAIVRKQPAAA